jgi:hypothetical protein
MMRRRDFIIRVGQTTAGALAFPALASAGVVETLEQKVKRLVEDVAPLRLWRFEQRGDVWEFFVGWDPLGELIGRIPIADESTVKVLSLVLPEDLQGKGIPRKLYDGWGGKATALTSVSKEKFPFLDGYPPSTVPP